MLYASTGALAREASVTPLQTNGLINIGLNGIANNGDIAGYAQDTSSNFEAVRWNGGQPQILNGLGGSFGAGLGISSDGTTIVGVSLTGSGDRHASEWRGSAVTDLGTLPGDPNSAALRFPPIKPPSSARVAK